MYGGSRTFTLSLTYDLYLVGKTSDSLLCFLSQTITPSRSSPSRSCAIDPFRPTPTSILPSPSAESSASSPSPAKMISTRVKMITSSPFSP
jgi:hypothetical protein